MSAAHGMPSAERIAEELLCVRVPPLCVSPDLCWPLGKCRRDVSGYMKAPRKRDVAAMRRKLLMWRECYSCHEAASDGHHIIFRSHGGDDVEENIAPLCHACHEILHTDTGDDAAMVRRQIGRSMLRSDLGEIAHVLDKKGAEGEYYLRRQYTIGPREFQKHLKRTGRSQ